MRATDDPFWLTRNPVGFARDAVHARGRIPVPRPPGPRGRPFTGVLREYRADPYGYLQRLADMYGDVYRLPLPSYDVVIVNHPDHVRHVMTQRDGEYSMFGPVSWLRRVLGTSMNMLEGEEFRQRRKLLTPMMSRQQLARIAVIVAEEVSTRLNAWDRFAHSGAPVDLQEELVGLLAPAFVRAMFSRTLPEDELRQLEADIRVVFFSVAAPLFLGPPPRVLPGADNGVQAWRRVRKWVNAQIERRLAEGRPSDDMMQVILDARYQDGTPISRRDAITEMIMLVGGGYENTVAALSWTFWFLDRNPDARQRLCDEVDALDGAAPTLEDLDQLRWTKACFDEGQRLQAHPFTPRFAMADDIVGGFRIRRGNVVGIPVHVLHRDPRWWGPNPDAYDPMRFYDKEIVAARPNLAFVPFSAGPHRCFGASMGYLQAQFVLALVHQRFLLRAAGTGAAIPDTAPPWPWGPFTRSPSASSPHVGNPTGMLVANRFNRSSRR